MHRTGPAARAAAARDRTIPAAGVKIGWGRAEGPSPVPPGPAARREPFPCRPAAALPSRRAGTGTRTGTATPPPPRAPHGLARGAWRGCRPVGVETRGASAGSSPAGHPLAVGPRGALRDWPIVPSLGPRGVAGRGRRSPVHSFPRPRVRRAGAAAMAMAMHRAAGGHRAEPRRRPAALAAGP